MINIKITKTFVTWRWFIRNHRQEQNNEERVLATPWPARNREEEKRETQKGKILESQHANWSLTEEGSRPEGETRETRNFSILGPNFLQWQLPRKGPIKDKLEKILQIIYFLGQRWQKENQEEEREEEVEQACQIRA